MRPMPSPCRSPRGNYYECLRPRHRHEVLRFPEWATAAHPGAGLHAVLDNYGRTSTQAPQMAGEARQPADHAAHHADRVLVTKHGRDLLRDHHPPGHPARHLHAVKDLSTAIGRFTGARNDRCQLFTWAKDAGRIAWQNQTIRN